MIARFNILLPFDLFVKEGDDLPTLGATVSGYSVTIHPLIYSAERPKLTDTLLGTSMCLQNIRVAPFIDSLRMGGRRVAQVNVLVMDFVKPEFDRNAELNTPVDPPPALAFEIANSVLARIRVHSRAFQIKPLEIIHDPWYLMYLRDDQQELEVEKDKVRGRCTTFLQLGFPALTSEIVKMAGDTSPTDEPYVWDQLLLDSFGLLPDVGSAIVIACAALETFITWALNILHGQQPLPNELWDWLNDRGDHTKEPSFREKFDVFLRVFAGHSLKEEHQLWQRFTELRDARNSLIHEGTARIGHRPVNAGKARELVNAASQIVKWVELLLPEARRRARTDAIGPFARRMATASEAAGLDLTGVEINAANQNESEIRLRLEPKAEKQSGSPPGSAE